MDGDIAFLSRSLLAFGSLLEQNNLLVERADYLKLLERTVKSFIGVFDRLAGSGYPRAQAYAGDGQRIGRRRRPSSGRCSGDWASSCGPRWRAMRKPTSYPKTSFPSCSRNRSVS